MKLSDLNGKNVVIWGTGREALAALHFIRRKLPDQKIIFVDEATGTDTLEDCPVFRAEKIPEALNKANIIIKSPGVSLYHPLLENAQDRAITITSLLNLWFGEQQGLRTICVTGTKGKSTTSSLIAHMLKKLGKKTLLLGNIGLPVSEADTKGVDFAVIEVSSYQAADFNATCDIAALTSLYPEHLDWHGTLDRYYRDKLNLLQHAKLRIINASTIEAWQKMAFEDREAISSNASDGIHADATTAKILDGDKGIGTVLNQHLKRPHNLVNVCTALTVMRALDLDLRQALRASDDFEALPHRQNELGNKDGILYVDDSISTTPQSAIAAMEFYGDKPITLIAGGYDRGIDYAPLVDYIASKKIHAVIFMGPSGERIKAALEPIRSDGLYLAMTMREAVDRARHNTKTGGVILLSPAAPSYGLFKDFTERGHAFAKESGFVG